MKVAVPLFDTRVSPRFDCAPAFLLATVQSGALTERQTADAQGDSPRARAEWLLGLGVQAVICGGIDAHSAQLLELNGIAVYSWVTGEAEDALTAMAAGRLKPMMMMGPGGRCCGRWRFRQGPGSSAWSQSKGGDIMPRGDGTGPTGQGPGTGKGMGPCGAGGGKRAGKGRGRGQGMGRGQGRRGSGGSGRGQ